VVSLMTDVVTASILNIDNPLSPRQLSYEYPLLSLDVVKEVNKITSAEIVLFDGDTAQQQFKASDSDFFKPGSKIKILLRYEGEKEETVFVGYVVKHGLRANHRRSTLTLYLKDPVIKLTQVRKNAVFRNLDDGNIIKDVIKTTISQDRLQNIHDLELGDFKPASTSATHDEMVQFYCSDWDFILSRAVANGLWILVDSGTVSLQSPALIKGNRIELEYGLDDIFDLDVEADIQKQYTSIDARAWDPETQTLTAAKTGDDYDLKQGDLAPSKLGKTIGAGQYHLVSGAALDLKEMKTWANAQTLHQRLSLLRGRIQISGRHDLHLGDTLVLKKIGDTFNGEALITGIRHQVNQQGWQTDLQFGLSSRATPLNQKEYADVPASGLLPAVYGLQVGVVNATSDDNGQLKVQVMVPWLTTAVSGRPDSKHDGLIWARLATLEAGLTTDGRQGRGTMFRPEPGDEVILGFVNDDPRQAVILGALNSVKNKPPFPVTVENNQRGLVTKENLKIVLADQTKSIRLETPATNHILMMDEAGISIVDEHENQVILNADGIQIKSGKDVEISAKGNVILKGANLYQFNVKLHRTVLPR